MTFFKNFVVFFGGKFLKINNKKITKRKLCETV